MLPNLIIIGAMKSGTTSLHYYLGLHPQIFMSKPKELNFFNLEFNWPKGVQWYESHFLDKTKIRGESSTSYTKYPTFKGVAERMYSILPEIKIIYLIRDPIERIISEYTHNFSQGRENRTFTDSLKNIENNHYVNCSKYYAQLEQYLKFYSISNILIITAYDLMNNRVKTLKKIFRFLHVQEAFYCNDYLKVFHKSIEKKRINTMGLFLKSVQHKISPEFKKIIKLILPSSLLQNYNNLTSSKINAPALSASIKKELTDHLRNDVEQLRQLTGYSFSDWYL